MLEILVYYFLTPGWFLHIHFVRIAGLYIDFRKIASQILARFCMMILRELLPMKPDWFLHIDFMRMTLRIKSGWFLRVNFKRNTLRMKPGWLLLGDVRAG